MRKEPLTPVQAPLPGHSLARYLRGLVPGDGPVSLILVEGPDHASPLISAVNVTERCTVRSIRVLQAGVLARAHDLSSGLRRAAFVLCVAGLGRALIQPDQAQASLTLLGGLSAGAFGGRWALDAGLAGLRAAHVTALGRQPDAERAWAYFRAGGRAYALDADTPAGRRLIVAAGPGRLPDLEALRRRAGAGPREVLLDMRGLTPLAGAGDLVLRSATALFVEDPEPGPAR